MTCHKCGSFLPYNHKLDDPRVCEGCDRRAERVSEVRYIISILEKGATAAQQDDLPGLKCALRDARHEIEDLERIIK